jgi:hypothetical protein
MKRAATFRLSPEALALILRTSEKLGISQAAVLELAIRLLAERENIERTK